MPFDWRAGIAFMYLMLRYGTTMAGARTLHLLFAFADRPGEIRSHAHLSQVDILALRESEKW